MSVAYAVSENAQRAARNTYCTPEWLTALLPEVDLDPCSNPRSTVRARRHIMLESPIVCLTDNHGPRGTMVSGDGLTVPWIGSVFVNPPYADIYPWALKAEEQTVTACAFLVNVDSSTSWWKRLQAHLQHALLFSKRIQFVPAHGIAVSSNSKPQALLCNAQFRVLCEGRLDEHGTWWQQ